MKLLKPVEKDLCAEAGAHADCPISFDGGGFMVNCICDCHQVNELDETIAVGFTPGPWKWSEHPAQTVLMAEDVDGSYVMGFVRKGMNGAQPTFPCMGSMEPGTDHPNARLIAAAPDLLAACEGARRTLEPHVFSHGPSAVAALSLDAAIAKAKGEAVAQ